MSCNGFLSSIISLGNDKVKDFPFIVNDQVQLEAKEPAQGTLPFLCYAFKGFVLFFPFDMADLKGVESIK
jgi:hypothetical protein